MADRGIYRGIYSALLDDPDFQSLTPAARHVLLTLRLCSQNSAASIFRYYAEIVMAQTGYSRDVLEAALQELERSPVRESPWVLREGPVVWVRNGLRYDPNLRLADEKHRKAVQKAIAGLPKLDIVAKFCDYYQIVRPFDGPSKALPRPIEEVSPPRPSPRPSPRTEKNHSPSSADAASGRGRDDVEGRRVAESPPEAKATLGAFPLPPERTGIARREHPPNSAAPLTNGQPHQLVVLYADLFEARFNEKPPTGKREHGIMAELLRTGQKPETIERLLRAVYVPGGGTRWMREQNAWDIRAFRSQYAKLLTLDA